MTINRNTRKIAKRALVRSSLTLLVLLLGFWWNLSVGGSQESSGPRTLSDVVLVTDEVTNLSTIYVADETTGAIYSRSQPSLNNERSSPLKTSDFKVFFRSSELSKPCGITYYKGKLVISDKALGAVFEIDTTTKTLNLILKGDPLKDPNRIAVSQSGRVAVSNNDGVLILYDRYGDLVILKHRFDSPVRLAFAGEDLLVLERTGTILSVQAKSLENEVPVLSPVQMPAKVGNDIAKILDFAFLNGVYYLMGENQVDAYIRSKGTAIQLFSQPVESRSLSGIAVNKQGIVLKDSRSNTLWQIERPIPVTANFGAGSKDSLIFLYKYLLGQNALPIRKFVATRDYKSLAELLLDQRILFDTSASTDEIGKFVCQLNESLCLQSPANDVRGTSQGVRKGQSLNLPDLTYTEVVGYERRELGGESVFNYLAKAFRPNLQSRFTEDFLWSLNELSKSETLEIQLQAKVPGALLATPPRRGVTPGTIMRVGQEQDSYIAPVTTCGIQYRYGVKTLNLAAHIKNSIKGDGAIAQLPRTSTLSSFSKRLKQLGIDQVQYELDGATVEQGDQKGIATAMTAYAVANPSPAPTPNAAATPVPSLTPDPKTCLTQLIGPGRYLVVDAVKVKSGRYKLFKNNSLVLLSKSDIQRLGLLGDPDADKEWSLVVSDPYYVAYRLSPWSDQAVLQSDTSKLIASPRVIRPGGSQDIFSLKEGSLLLPYVSQLQITFLIKETELTSETSEFSKLKAAHNFTALRSEETIRMSTTRIPSRTLDSGPDLPLTVVTEGRELLKKQINYRLPDLPAALREIKIGIGEKPCSVDKRHPDFIDKDGANAWIDTPDGGNPTNVYPCSGPAPTAGEPRVKSNIDDDNDHGTHVAGLIGARSNSRAPGLLPSARLFLVDASSPDSISTATYVAVQRNVFIFNFSFGLDGNDADLRRAITNDWKKQLFIVAVDNEGSDLTDSAAPLVSWIADIKNNMIGVGSAISAAGTEYVLGDWVDPKGQILTGSSYSKKYVHLLAPGYGIYSTTSGNSYGGATGASQAAPQVTSVAAMLFAAGYREPERIKARLIYTADWFEQLRGKVWGGFLNVNRATWEPDRNLFTTRTEANKIRSIVLDEDLPNRMKIKFKLSTKYDNPGDEESLPPGGLDIPFSHILRITRLPSTPFRSGTYRVIYVDANSKQVKIVMNAELAGTFPCRSLEDYDGQTFIASQCKSLEGVDITQVVDYWAKVPERVTF